VIFILLDIFLEPTLSYFQSRKSPSNLPHMLDKNGYKDTKLHKQYEWNATSTLQLQRLAHEGIGCGEWSRTANETPVTLLGQELGILHLTEKNGKIHPRLVNHTATFNTAFSGATLGRPETLNSVVSKKPASAGDSDHIGHDLSIHPIPPVDQSKQ
jgi:hypothetical protein